VDLLNAPSYRGDLKPYVEANFHITNEIIRQLLSGSTEPGQRVRGDKDPSVDSALTIEEFHRFMIVYILTYNKSALTREYLPTKDMFADKVDLTPIGVWNWSAGNRLLHEKSKNELIYNLFPREEAKVSRHGIEFHKLCYTTELAIKEGWFDGNGNGINGQREVEICYDPRNCSSIFLKHKKGLIQCFLTGRFKEFEDLCFAEVDKILEYRDNQINIQEKAEKQHRAELHAFAEVLDKQATKEMKDATQDISFSARKKNKREVRMEESNKWSASVAMTRTTQDITNDPPNDEKLNNNVVQFPYEEEDITPTKNLNEIKSLFSRKNSERRDRDE
jgi:hypothetical protein